jgi:DegT/DnrJ/EryC1/StrS aminotransferase family
MTFTSTTDHHRYYAFARQALVQALILARVQPGDNVLVPALICKDVVASIHTVGAHPIFYPVDESLCPVELASRPRTTAVIAVNYFGFAQDLAIFHEFCSKTGAKLIEDNAHGYLSVDVHGKLLGTRSHFGITSIRKTIRIPDGAQLSVNDPESQHSVPEQIPFQHKFLGFRFTLQSILVNLQKICKLPFLYWSQVVTRLLRKAITGAALPSSPPNAEYEKIDLSAPRDSSMKRIMKLDIDKETRRRRALYDTVNQMVSKSSATPVFQALPPNCVPYGFPFYGDTESAKSIEGIVRHLGVEVINWPELPESVNENAPNHYKQLWLVNFL